MHKKGISFLKIEKDKQPKNYDLEIGSADYEIEEFIKSVKEKMDETSKT